MCVVCRKYVYLLCVTNLQVLFNYGIQVENTCNYVTKVGGSLVTNFIFHLNLICRSLRGAVNFWDTSRFFTRKKFILVKMDF